MESTSSFSQPLAIITGFSGAGKTTIAQELLYLHQDQLVKAITSTTRPPRDGEEHGIHYHFLEPDHFHTKRESGHFLETSEHYGHHYGSMRPEHIALASDQIPLYVLDVNGTIAAKQEYPHAHTFFVHIPQYLQAERLGERNEDPAILLERLSRYEHEEAMLRKHAEHFILLPNSEPDDLKTSIDLLRRTLQLG